jgi:hypothetical protein
MDQQELDRRLAELSQQAMAQAKAAVQAAPEGQWIAGSEWQIREIFQRLSRESYQLMLQAKIDAQAARASFSPSPGSAAAQQGPAALPGADRRR